MGPVIGDLLPLAVGVAISPVPITAVILMLLAHRAGGASAGFLLGWVIGIAVVTGVILLAAGGADRGSTSEPSALASWLKLVLGVLLLLVAVRQWRGRPAPGEPRHLLKWMAAINTLTPPRAPGWAACSPG